MIYNQTEAEAEPNLNTNELMTDGGHVGPIIFSDDTARSQLLDHGDVVTFRKSERTTGETWWRESRTGKKKGDVRVEHLARVDPSEDSALDPYVDRSGFADVGAWRDAIRSLNGGLPDSGLLYCATAKPRQPVTDGGEDQNPEDLIDRERVHGSEFPAPGNWMVHIVEMDGVSWELNPDTDEDEITLAGTADARSYLWNDFEPDGSVEHRLEIDGETVLTHATGALGGGEWDADGLWTRVGLALMNADPSLDADHEIPDAGEPLEPEQSVDRQLDEFVTDGGEPQRVPVTLSEDHRAEVLDTETCDGADGFECGRELARGEDEINVTEFGPGASRSGRRVLCGECRKKQNAVNLSEMPDVAAMYSDEELDELRERFPEILADVDLEQDEERR